jgi:hypothetical protein
MVLWSNIHYATPDTIEPTVFCFTSTRPLQWCHMHHPPSLLHQFWSKIGKPWPNLLHDEASYQMSTCVLTTSSSAHRFWSTNWQTSSHLVLRVTPRNRCGDFEAQITKPLTLVFSSKPRICHGDLETQITKPSPLVLRLVGVKYRRSPVTAQNSRYDQFPPAVNGWGTIHPIP